MKKFGKLSLILTVLIVMAVFVAGCAGQTGSTDSQQAAATETLMQQANAKLGLPNIKNFYEKSMMKSIMEACDDSNLITYSYVKNDMSGKFVYLGESLGYGLPYGTEYTNPEYIPQNTGWNEPSVLPQPDPNGLYKAQNVNATWIMLINPKTKQAKPFYEESDTTVSPFKLPSNLCESWSLPSDY